MDQQLEKTAFTARWLADFLEVPRGRIYRVINEYGAAPIGRKGQAAVYDAKTIVRLAECLQGHNRFNSWSRGGVSDNKIERLKDHLDYVEGQEQGPTEPDGLWSNESSVWQALSTAAADSELPPKAPAFTILSLLQAAALQAGEEYPELKRHIELGIDQFAGSVGFDTGAWQRFGELLGEVAPVAANPRPEPAA